MGKIKPPNPRAILSDGVGGFRIIIPAKRNWFIILLVGFWLVGWAVGEFVVSRELLEGRMQGPVVLFSIAWLGGWTVGGGVAILTWLWNLIGKEVVILDRQSLMTRREIGQYGRSNEFALAQVRDLRVSLSGFNPWDFSSALQFWGLKGGSIAFDYGARTFRFGNGLDEAEAKHIVSAIQERFKIPKTESQ